MKVLKSLYMKNVSVYKEAYLPLDKIGITQIRGNNLDAKSTEEKDVNAVGKSLLIRPLSEITFNSNPLTQKIKSRTKMDLMTSNDSEYGYTVEHNDTEYTFIKKAAGSTFKYIVRKNGKDTKIARKNYAQEKIHSVMDYSEEEFYTFYYIDSSRDTKLQMGTPAERISFFTNLFQLNSYDNVRKIFNGKLAECKKSAAALKEVKSQIESTSLLSDEDYAEYKKQLKSLKKDSKEVIHKFDTLSDKKSTLEFIKDNRDNYGKLSVLMHDHKVSFDQINELKAVIKEYEEGRKLEAKWDAYRDALKSYNKKVEKLQSKIENLTEGKEFKTKALVKAIDSLQEKTKEQKKILKDKPEKPEFDSGEYNELKKSGLKKPDYYRDEITKLKRDVQVNKETLEALGTIKGSECPTCTQSVNKSTLKKLKSTYSDKIEKNSDTIEDYTSKLKKSKKLSELKSEKDDFEKELEKYNADIKVYKEAKANYKNNTERLEKLGAVLDLHKKLESLDKPVKPKKEAKVSITPKEYKEKLNLVTLMESMESIYDKLSDLETELDFNTIDEQMKKVSKEYKDLNKKLSKITDKISDVSSKVTNYKNEKRNLEKLEARKDELQSNVNDIPIIETIIEAYSNKGMKLMVIKQIAKMLEANMNKYAPLLYPEKMKFKFEVNSDRDFNIMSKSATRGQYSDVRNLSGAERRAFSFLVPLSILPMIPKERRLNIMILDEPMVNMGRSRMSLFVESFIPKLSQIVPHLIIISTEDEEYKDADIYTATKQNGRTTLVKS